MFGKKNLFQTNDRLNRYLRCSQIGHHSKFKMKIKKQTIIYIILVWNMILEGGRACFDLVFFTFVVEFSWTSIARVMPNNCLITYKLFSWNYSCRWTFMLGYNQNCFPRMFGCSPMLRLIPIVNSHGINSVPVLWFYWYGWLSGEGAGLPCQGSGVQFPRNL